MLMAIFCGDFEYKGNTNNGDSFEVTSSYIEDNPFLYLGFSHE